MRENRPSGSEGGAAETNRPSLPLSGYEQRYPLPFAPQTGPFAERNVPFASASVLSSHPRSGRSRGTRERLRVVLVLPSEQSRFRSVSASFPASCAATTG